MPRRRNPLFRWLSTFAAIAFARFTALLPLPATRALGRSIGRAIHALVPRARLDARAHLDLAFGDSISRTEKDRILRGACANLGIVAAEFSRAGRLARPESGALYSVEGLEHVDRSRGALMIGAHLGNWEWMCGAATAIGLRVAEVVRPLDDPRLDAFVDGMRRASGASTISKDNAGGEIIRKLRDGWFVGVLIDQSPRDNAAPATFFGHPCWATIAPAMVALRSKAPIHPVSMTRNADGTYTLRFHPALSFARSGDFRRDLQAIAQQCQDAVEAMVREYPDQWLWLHRRWKPRGRLESEWAARAGNS